MSGKLFCPNCGRCLGEFISSDDTGISKTLIKRPTKLKRKQVIYDVKCVRCKERVYISMEFVD